MKCYDVGDKTPDGGVVLARDDTGLVLVRGIDEDGAFVMVAYDDAPDDGPMIGWGWEDEPDDALHDALRRLKTWVASLEAGLVVKES